MAVGIKAEGMPVRERTTGLLAVIQPNRIIHMHTDINCSGFHLRVFLGLSNPRD
jgi:hypothetical protein